MLWVAAFLALIIWVVGVASDFLGFRIHIFLLFAILCGLIALLPSRTASEDEVDVGDDPPVDANAKSVPAGRGDAVPTHSDPTTIE